MKQLVREMALSATYRQESNVPETRRLKDEPNRYWSRMERRRLTAEQWRDTVLQKSGALERAGGPSMEISDPTNHKRTLYARISRLELDSFLQNFDYPDANVHAATRAVTTTSMQKLFMLNSPFMVERSRGLAERIHREAGGTDTDRVRHAYALLFARQPADREIEMALAFLEGKGLEKMTRWEQYAQALLASNEFLYVD